jgi:hypothetical protein
MSIINNIRMYDLILILLGITIVPFHEDTEDKLKSKMAKLGKKKT